MASIITATTSSGLVSSADNSGVLQLASGTGNLVTVPSVTGTAMVSGNMPTFSAYQASGGQSISNSTATKVVFNTEEWDTANCFDSTTNYRFTPNVAGYYQVDAQICLDTLSPTEAQYFIYKNGSQYKRGMRLKGVAIEPYMIVSALVYLNGSTDYIEMYVFQASGGSASTENLAPNGFRGTYFQAAMIRGA